MIPFQWTKEEIGTLRAVYADPAGRIALDAIMYRLGMLHQASFAPDPYLTAYNEGRRFVAGQLHNALTLPVESLIEEKHESRHRTLTATERAAGHGGTGRR